jgi:cyanophycinase
MSEYPGILCVGIDEATALVIHGKNASVAGESQVVYMKNRGNISRDKNNYLRFENVRIKIFVPGDRFKIK